MVLPKIRGCLAVLFVILLAGCVTAAYKMNDLAIGMTKDEVLQVLGPPVDTRATESVEYITYVLRGGMVGMGKYFVQLKQGRVTAYGALGDFDSTQNPEATINLNKTIKEIK